MCIRDSHGPFGGPAGPSARGQSGPCSAGPRQAAQSHQRCRPPRREQCRLSGHGQEQAARHAPP
eukprot:14670219-Alexandrium_andersonii.AAC.1